MAKVKVFVFVDALGWEQVEKYGFLKDLLPNRRKIEMQFGYSCTAIPTILSGRRPDEHGHLAFYDWAPGRSPFRKMRFLAPFLRPRSFWRRGRVRNVLSRLVKRLYGFTGYFQLYGVPVERLPKLDYCEKTDLFVPGGLAPVKNLADVWSEQGMKYHISDWRLPESENFRIAAELFRKGAVDRAFVYSAAFDALQHDNVGRDEVLRPKVEKYADTVRALHAALVEGGRPFELTVFSDHGMTPLRGTADAPAALAGTGLVWGEDYASAIDSTMARFWWLKPEAEGRVKEAFAGFSGHWLTEDEMRYHGIWREDRKFGDAIFLADAGVQFCPSDMGVKPLNGMHGFDPADKDSCAAWLSTAPVPDSVTRVCDYFSVMAGADDAGRAPAAALKGVLPAALLWLSFAVCAFGAAREPALKTPNLKRPWAEPSFLTEHRPAAKAPQEHVPGFLFLEAEDFADYGGWRLDTQFTHKMGSAYLIASSVGTPVAPAKASVGVPRGGTWRVWARTKDWLPEFSPGRFVVAVGGAEGQVVGASKRGGWSWEIAGDYDLPAGEASVELRDRSGYFGRCDALIFTDDFSYVPPEEPGPLAAERRRLKGESAETARRGSFDLVVVGAGSGGVPAALAAARGGIRVALVGDRPVLGGNSSDEIGVNMCGACYDKPAGRETGIAEETTCLRARFDTPAMSQPLARLVAAETNITVFLCERVLEAGMDGGRIAYVVSRNVMTGRRSRIDGRLFVDATGDGWLGYFAGAKYRQGRESSREFGEKFAPEHADTLTMSGLLQEPKVGVCYWAEDAGSPVPYETPEFARILPPGFTRDVQSPFGVWWLEHPAWFDDCADPERARDELLRISFAYWGWIKNVSPQRGAAATYRLREVPIMDGRRESRRLVGDYILNSNDCLEGRVFPDAVAYGGWPLDTHEPLGIQAVDTDGHRYPCERIPFYTIPFRSLYSVNVPNLMMAGRDISASHIALGSTRVQLTCMVIGQAVGTAAAMCVKEGMEPRELGIRRIGALQRQLIKDDAYIPGFANDDPDDLARTAVATASSSDPETRRFSHGDIVTYTNASPSAVVDGVTRPVGREAHAWVSSASGRLPQWIRLDLADAAEVGEVRLTFDTDLEFNAWRYRIADELVRDYRVEGTLDGKTWFPLVAVRDNYMRHRVHRFPPRRIKAVRLTVDATYGSTQANVFEIRLYRP